jgi:hypothetical protein
MYCTFHHESGNIHYKDICFLSDGTISNECLKESTMYDKVLSKHIYVHNNTFYKKRYVGDYCNYQMWKKTRSGDWDWFIQENIPKLITIDNFLETSEKETQYKLLLEGTLDYIDKHGLSMNQASISTLKNEIIELFMKQKFEMLC